MEKEVLEFQLKRNFAVLSRGLLSLLEDLRKQHDLAFQKLQNVLPPDQKDTAYLIDYFDENNFSHYRKRFLDLLNGARRELEFVINEE